MNRETALPMPGERRTPPTKKSRSTTNRFSTTRPPRLELAPAPKWHALVEWSLRLFAASAVLAIALILIFIAKEAAPLLYNGAIRHEVTLAKMWFSQMWPGYDESASIWQPVSEIPKFGILPLIIGTLKVTIVSMSVGVPLGVGSALYVSQYARPRTREIVEAAHRAARGHPVGRARLLPRSSSWRRGFQNLFGFDSRLNADRVGRRAVFRRDPRDLPRCPE